MHETRHILFRDFNYFLKCLKCFIMVLFCQHEKYLRSQTYKTFICEIHDSSSVYLVKFYSNLRQYRSNSQSYWVGPISDKLFLAKFTTTLAIFWLKLIEYFINSSQINLKHTPDTYVWSRDPGLVSKLFTAVINCLVQ